MQELFPEIDEWVQEGKQVVIATVVKAYGSAPRPPGSKMAISSQDEIIGSVSGGCVEAAVFEEAKIIFKTHQPKLVRYGITNNDVMEIGLACGGTIEVFIELLDWQVIEMRIFYYLTSIIIEGKTAVLATVISGSHTGKKLLITPHGDHQGTLGDVTVDEQVIEQSPKFWKKRDPLIITIDNNVPEASMQIFIDKIYPKPHLIIIGAVHIAIPLITYAKILNFHTKIIDPRAIFITRARFPHADELIHAWPQDYLDALNFNESSCLVTLAHDEKIDVPALATALKFNSGYIGALGSRKTHEKRIEALREFGFSDDQLARIHTPVGLDIGAKTPEEIALAIMAEIIASQHGV